MPRVTTRCARRPGGSGQEPGVAPRTSPAAGAGVWRSAAVTTEARRASGSDGGATGAMNRHGQHRRHHGRIDRRGAYGGPRRPRQPLGEVVRGAHRPAPIGAVAGVRSRTWLPSRHGRPRPGPAGPGVVDRLVPEAGRAGRPRHLVHGVGELHDARQVADEPQHRIGPPRRLVERLVLPAPEPAVLQVGVGDALVQPGVPSRRTSASETRSSPSRAQHPVSGGLLVQPVEVRLQRRQELGADDPVGHGLDQPRGPRPGPDGPRPPRSRGRPGAPAAGSHPPAPGGLW